MPDEPKRTGQKDSSGGKGVQQGNDGGERGEKGGRKAGQQGSKPKPGIGDKK
jgi:hypothetical protein